MQSAKVQSLRSSTRQAIQFLKQTNYSLKTEEEGKEGRRGIYGRRIHRLKEKIRTIAIFVNVDSK